MMNKKMQALFCLYVPMISRDIKSTTGNTKPLNKNTTAKMRIKAYGSNLKRISEIGCGSEPNSTFDPSSGGMGIMLNTAKIILMKTIL